MIIKNVSLDIVCGITSTLPDTELPEVAFAGKSNVGKSSLINALMNRKALARTSASPGKTQTINFYNINDAMYLVDLPGYGYAKVSQSVKEQWGKLIERYLQKSKQLYFWVSAMRSCVLPSLERYSPRVFFSVSGGLTTSRPVKVSSYCVMLTKLTWK